MVGMGGDKGWSDWCGGTTSVITAQMQPHWILQNKHVIHNAHDVPALYLSIGGSNGYYLCLNHTCTCTKKRL